MAGRRWVHLIVIITVLLAATAYARKVPLPQNLGHVVLNNFTEATGMEPVFFEHWRHRANFTCRLCHIDVGFAMQEKATGITADLNRQGYYCGSCHNGQRIFNGKELFASCAENYTEEEGKRCAYCHVRKSKQQREDEFNAFSEDLPRLRVGNLIDWEKAELERAITLVDYLEGVSYERDQMKAQEDFSIEVTSWASDVIFSHKKHAKWNGCELCHPLIFPSSQKDTVNYTMFQIIRGEYCGICHVSVSFPVWLCYKCHSNPVQ